MEIRRLGEADAAIYWALRLRALKEEPRAFGGSYEEQKDWPLEQAATARLRASEHAPDSAVFGAFDEAGQLVGMIGIRRDEGRKVRHKAMIWGVYVAPEARGQKLGARLLETAIAFGRQMPGLEQIMLAVAVGNQAARARYVAAGFVPWGVEPHALKLDDDDESDESYVDEESMVLFLR